jgi:hypothetical protein
MNDEDFRELMLDYEIDHATAARAQELIDSGLDEDEAVGMAAIL